MTWQDREDLRVMENDINMGFADNTPDPEELTARDAPPPGEEGDNLSHEGGEFHVYNNFISELTKTRGAPRQKYVSGSIQSSVIQPWQEIQLPHTS